MFKLRPGGQSGANSPAQPPTIDAMRRRARHRLIGASVLVLAGVIGFPLLFDTQPRPIPVNIPIDIPAKNSAKPLVVPAATATPPAAVQVEGLDAKEEIVASAPVNAPVTAKAVDSAPKTASGASAAVESKPQAEPVKPKAAEKPVAKPVEKSAEKAAEKHIEKSAEPKDDKSSQRFVVQVGAFAETAGAQQARQKLERAGLKTYTHEANLPEGRRIRVRLGPFSTKAEAEKAAAKAKAQGLPASILTL